MVPIAMIRITRVTTSLAPRRRVGESPAPGEPTVIADDMRFLSISFADFAAEER